MFQAGRTSEKTDPAADQLELRLDPLASNIFSVSLVSCVS